MFENIILRRAENSLPISIGQIAEALLYYQKVHIFIDRSTLFKLIEQIGTSHILTLLRRPEVSAVYCEEMLFTASDSAGISPFYKYCAGIYAGDQKKGRLKPLQERLERELKFKGVSELEAMRFSRAFVDKVPNRKLSGNYFLQGGILEAAKRDLLDVEYIEQALHTIIAAMPGGYVAGENLKFKVINSDLGMFIDTNINLDLINRRRSQLVPPTGPLTISHLLSYLLEARADLTLASFYGGDFVTSDVNSSIIQVRHAELLKRSNINVDSLRQFTEIILPDSPSLAEVIDSGERSFDDFLNLLDDAAKWKEFLKGVNPDEGLVRSYMNMNDISSHHWFKKLPPKILSYVLTSSVLKEIENPVIQAIIELVGDSILEKLFTGWRPNHFVSKKLTPFVN